jgi:hypothetical protein
MEEILTSIALLIVLPIVYGLFYRLKEAEEKRITYDSVFTVKMNKGILAFFFIWMVICFAAMVLVLFLFAKEAPNRISAFWVSECVCFAFFTAGAIGFLMGKFNYLVVDNEGIIIKKLFQKPRMIQYSDISYIYHFDGVSCYDADGIPLLSADHFHVGADRLYAFLQEKGYPSLPVPYPSEDMKNNIRLINYKKKASLKTGLWCFMIFGLVSIGMGILLNTEVEFRPYENYEVTGTIESYTTGDEIIKIKLVNDSREYFINNVVSDRIDEDLYDDIRQGTPVVFHIAYVDEYERHNISQIQINDKVYLDMEDAENSEYSNYRDTIMLSYILIGIGGFLIVLGGINFRRIKKMNLVMQ